MIKVRLSSIPLGDERHGYVKRYRGGATIYLDRGKYDEPQAAAMEALIGAGLAEGVFGWWDGEIVKLDEDAVEPDLPIGQSVR